MKRILSSLGLLATFASLTVAAEQSLELSDINGKTHQPLLVDKKKAVVLIFISRDCPTSNAFVPEMNRLASSYEKDFACWLVYADAGISATDAKKHAEIFGIKATVLLDPEQHLVKLTKAKVTPEAVVIGSNSEILYQGRINDLYITQTKKLTQPTTQDLRDSLDAILAGKSATNTSTKAIGCSIR